MFPFIKKLKKIISPTYLISFPRSGSNFVQNVITKSSGTYNYSIYYFGNNEYRKCLTIKSHALSYSHLIAEVARFIPSERNLPAKFIILWRDPRDIMISFYEFIQKRYDISLSQGEFLSNEVNYVRHVIGFPPLPILEAYKVFMLNWRSGNKLSYGDQNTPWIEIKYEDILNQPEIEFDRIFNFLGIKCKLNKYAVSEKVSFMEDKRPERCIAGSWRKFYKDYKKIVDATSNYLESEIRILGYIK
ncbi:MAG: sulfotransferase domain-containing protein [Candidatus Marinimicrobia bacterium]|nr:sulfotransferase domain-containing protein [Candidatus Neomarinimicrobiota bacterium]